MKPRILQLTGSFYSGGSERQAASLAIGLRQEGRFDVQIATLNREGVLRKDVEEAGFSSIPEFPLSSFFGANFVKQVRRCSRYLAEQRIDLVHTHDFYTNVFGMAAATLAGTKVKVASKRETAGMRTRAQDVVERLAFAKSDRIVVNAEAVRSSLVDRNVPADKLSLIYNGIDLARFKAQSPAAGERSITLVANLRHTVKNVPMFLEAAQLVATRVPDVQFVIAGEGELETPLRAIADERGIADRTQFLGRCDDIPELLASSFACVLTSTAEGFSNSILEYMAAGKPVVATDVGGAREAIVEGGTGYLVESNDVRAMADRLLELLDDPPHANELGQAGRTRVARKFSREAQLDATISFYNSLLDR